jgi:hypothetical protein
VNTAGAVEIGIPAADWVTKASNVAQVKLSAKPGSVCQIFLNHSFKSPNLYCIFSNDQQSPCDFFHSQKTR